MSRWSWPSRSKTHVAPDPWQVLAREEARLWVWLALVTGLAMIGFALAAIPLPISTPYAALHLRYDQAAPALLLLTLLFNAQMLRRRWIIRRGRKELNAAKDARLAQELIPEAAGIDEVTGLGTRKAAEVQLGKEMAIARRRGEPLSLLIVGLEDFSRVSARIGSAATEELLREFVRRLRRATRGGDFLVRFAADEFLAILPGCALSDVARVARRLQPLNVPHGHEELTVEFTTGWLDPQPGETPDGPLKRAHEMLRLYKDVERTGAA